ncbi:hypothetical protein KAR63_03615 [Weissella uvarum]|nr:hypothetical protein [Weissella uvarum]
MDYVEICVSFCRGQNTTKWVTQNLEDYSYLNLHIVNEISSTTDLYVGDVPLESNPYHLYQVIWNKPTYPPDWYDIEELICVIKNIMDKNNQISIKETT